jgi:hypothetical protein
MRSVIRGVTYEEARRTITLDLREPVAGRFVMVRARDDMPLVYAASSAPRLTYVLTDVPDPERHYLVFIGRSSANEPVRLLFNERESAEFYTGLPPDSDTPRA